ncbi:oligosaccharide flippase family protein [Enterococcus sp. DIV0876]|uniref:oligosaccharide flippase family protein n=1 Tax=Enterococcus sp. DIV0876 TaxID=2774633 RepID=UPI003D2FA02F
MKSINEDIAFATKWAGTAEVMAKLVTPISNMILARVLTPEIFGIVATITMVNSFADIFSDAGFQKFLIQHEFSTKEKLYKSTNVAFITNLAISILAWLIIFLFRNNIANIIGIQGLGNVLAISCLTLPLTSFSSIQIALFKRNFDFKKLFYARFVGILTPFFVTVPLAFVYKNYWAMIIGTLIGQLFNALILTFLSDWKPRFYYNFHKLKEMLSFSLWTLCESLLSWLGNYGGIFVIGIYLSNYYLGLYRTSINISNSILSIIISSTLPVLFSSLSRLNNERKHFFTVYYDFQKNIGLILIPLGTGIFLYRDLVTGILLGDQWHEAANFIGIWSLANVFKLLLSSYCLEAFRAIGKPKISVFIQMLQILVMLPLLYWGAQQNFQILYLIRSSICIILIIFSLITWNVIFKQNSLKQILNISPYIISSIIMYFIGTLLQVISNSYIWSFVSIVLLIVVYFVILTTFFKEDRKKTVKLLNSFYFKIKKRTMNGK